jgi:16S rRNA C1402 N4-methylase RsmH
MPIAFKHQPVLFHEVMEWIRPKAGGAIWTARWAAAATARESSRPPGNSHLYGIDRDLEAIAAATERLIGYPGFTPSTAIFTTPGRCWPPREQSRGRRAGDW